MVGQLSLDQSKQGEKAISNWIKSSKTIQSIERLPGDASTRRYYRIKASAQSYIVMKMEPFADEGKTLPFLEVQKHLTQAGVDVPAVLDFEPKQGFILLEDLGDTTLLRKLQDVSHADTEYLLYQQAIDALVTLQVNATPPSKTQKKQPSLKAFGLRFDEEKLMWEVQFTIENFYQLFLKRKLKERDLKIIQRGFEEICALLAKQPTLLTHRDYHSRNLMIPTSKKKSERMVMIDFQDARMGPAQYDLASLLKDSYYQLEETQVNRLIRYYIAQTDAQKKSKINQNEFNFIFDLMSIQRNFKAIGSFASFVNKRGDPSYLKYIGNTFENIRRTLLKYPQYSKLREVLFHYYYF